MALALTSTGDLLVLVPLLAVASRDRLVGVVTALAVAATAWRWGSTALSAVAGAQAVVGAAVTVGPVAAAASSALAAVAVVAAVGGTVPAPPAERFGLAALVAGGLVAGLVAAGPAAASIADGGVRAVSAVVAVLAVLGVRQIVSRVPGSARFLRAGAVAAGAVAVLAAGVGA